MTSAKRWLLPDGVEEILPAEAYKLESLRRFKDDVDEVRSGLECGVVLADTNDIRAGDQLEVFEVTEQERTL